MKMALKSTRSRPSHGVLTFNPYCAQKVCLEMMPGLHFYFKPLRHVRSRLIGISQVSCEGKGFYDLALVLVPNCIGTDARFCIWLLPSKFPSTWLFSLR